MRLRIVTEYIEKEYPGCDPNREVIHSADEDLKKAAELIKEAQRPYDLSWAVELIAAEASEELYGVCTEGRCTGNRFSDGERSISRELMRDMPECSECMEPKASNFGVSAMRSSDRNR